MYFPGREFPVLTVGIITLLCSDQLFAIVYIKFENQVAFKKNMKFYMATYHNKIFAWGLLER